MSSGDSRRPKGTHHGKDSRDKLSKNDHAKHGHAEGKSHDNHGKAAAHHQGGGGRGGGGAPKHHESLDFHATVGKLPEVVVGDANTVKEAPFLPYKIGTLPVAEDLLKKTDYSHPGGDTYVVMEVKCIKWTHSVVFGVNKFVGRDVALVEERCGALPGDVVLVRLLPHDEWYAKEGYGDDVPTGVTSKEYREGTAELPDGRKVHKILEHRATVPLSSYSAAERIHVSLGLPTNNIAKDAKWPDDAQPRGKICEVLERGFKRLHPCRVFHSGDGPVEVKADRYVMFKPYNQAYPIVAVYGRDIPSALWEILHELLVLVEINVESKGDMENVPFINGKYPIGRVLMSLGRSGTVEAESRAIAASNGIVDSEFTDEVNNCVVQNFTVPKDAAVLETMNRRDLREEEFVCTIDPATARDLDDALSISRDKNTGHYRVGVHIADVSYFVPVGSKMDQEAKSRSTSTYFVEKVVPMLPRKLSEDYCSLNEGTDKFAFSSLFIVTRDGEVISEWFGQSVIRNRCRMAYEDAQKIIDGDESGETLKIHESEYHPNTPLSRDDVAKKVVKSVKTLFELAKTLREKRYAGGALSLNKSKIRFFFEDFNSRLSPAGFGMEKSREANWTIEEFMLLCNIRTAQKIVQYLPDCGMLRKHDGPQAKKIKAFLQATAEYGYQIEAGSSLQLNRSLQKYADDKNSDALRLMATYCMSLAMYTSSGGDSSATENQSISVRHYALATDVYTHFTSPIRRYPDIVAHRQLQLALALERIVNEKVAGGMSEAAAVRTTGLKDIGIALTEDGDVVVPEDEEEPDHTNMHLGAPDISKFYLQPFEVSAIADNANAKKLAARRCSDASLSLYFCLYLNALRKQAESSALSAANPAPVVHYARAIVVKTGADKFSLYAPDIAQDFEVFHNAQMHGTQKWVATNIVEANNIKFLIQWGFMPGNEPKHTPHPAIEEDLSTDASRQKKGDFHDKKGGAHGGGDKKKSRKDADNDDLEDDEEEKKAPTIAPGEVEQAGLFYEFVVELVVKNDDGMKLVMEILPPWARNVPVTKIASTLDN